MRSVRLLAALLLTLVLLSVSGVALSTAQAAPKPHRTFTYAKIVKLPNGSLRFRARVANYPNSFIGLMKKTCLTCTWTRVALRRTDAGGHVDLPVQAPPSGRWYWRYRTPETPKFALSYSSTWYTYRQ